MQLLLAISIAFAIGAVLLLFRINMQAFQEARDQLFSYQSLHRLIHPEKEGRAVRSIRSTLFALRMMGQERMTVLLFAASFFLVMVGIVGGLSFDNVFLIPVFAAALAMIPFIYAKSQYISYCNMLLEQLETGLSVITNSYLRTENLLSAIHENADGLEEPLKGVFLQFLASVEGTGVSMADALEEMKGKVNNTIFSEWIDAMKKCMRDRTVKAVVPDIVGKFSDVQEAAMEAKTELQETTSSYYIVMVLGLFFMLLTYLAVPSVLGIAVSGLWLDFMFALQLFLIVSFTLTVTILIKNIKLELGGQKS